MGLLQRSVRELDMIIWAGYGAGGKSTGKVLCLVQHLAPSVQESFLFFAHCLLPHQMCIFHLAATKDMMYQSPTGSCHFCLRAGVILVLPLGSRVCVRVRGDTTHAISQLGRGSSVCGKEGNTFWKCTSTSCTLCFLKASAYKFNEIPLTIAAQMPV